MATTRGEPDPQVPPVERALDIAYGAIAGRGLVRRVVLYTLAFILTVSPFPLLAVAPLALLMATDTAL